MENYVKPSKVTKERVIQLLIGLGLQIVAFGVCIALFKVVTLGPLIQESVDVSGEMSNPTVARLVYCIFSFLLGVGLVFLSNYFNKKEKTEISFGLAFGAGVLFWQSIGECLWHFSIRGTNFVRLECQQSLPIAIIFTILLFVYGFSKHKNFAIWVCALSFATNYLGHFITLGIYPFLPTSCDWKMYCISVSCIMGAFATAAGVILSLFCSTNKKANYISSILIFIGIAVIVIGFIES